MWRSWNESDQEEIIKMSLALYVEDPAAKQVSAEDIRKTLSILRAQPARGQAVVLDLAEVVVGYAFLISFWSNELGGEIVTIDEIYIKPPHRNQGHGRSLFRLLAGRNPLWNGHPVALELEVTPQNSRAMRLYAELGFKPARNTRMRLLV